MSALDAEGKTYKSFAITKYLPLEQLQSTLIEAVHEPSGARILHIANDDPENLFCLSFQTLPNNSNGVAHILEHTVLCGSKKFPIKDPFFSMTRRSLNTYMNALTGQDFTCYPASSQIEKDFYNLLEVYLDAVFHPELKEKSFLQEGHRLEFAEPKNPKSPLQFQGIVYNEMKGALTSIETRLWEAVMKHLTPDLPYSYNSGGDPKEIPTLTYKELKEFHRTFYHPSRCLFFFYGNLPLSKHLDFILEKAALENVRKIPLLPPLPLQKRFSSPVEITERYPISETESLEKKTLITFSWLTAPLAAQDEVLALCLLNSLLMDTDASPLKKALLKSGLCTQAESSIDTEMSEAPFSLVCKGCDTQSAKELKALIFDTLKHCSFTPEEIEASIHQLEFQRVEIGVEGIPFGLVLFFRAGIVKQHGIESEHSLLIHTLFKDLRDRISAEPEFLQNMLKKHLIDNPHFVQLVLYPDPNLQKEELQEEQKRLSRVRSHIDETIILSQSKELTAYQEEIEAQSLDCLPKLSIRDIPSNARDFLLHEEEQKNLIIDHHACFTNKILYADLIYDLPDLPASDLPLLSLYTRFITELGCNHRNYIDNLAYQQAYTGGVEAFLALHVSQENPDLLLPIFSIRGKAMERNSEKLLSLFADFIQGADCTDHHRIQELLSQQVTSLQNRLVKNALNYAVQTSLSGFSNTSYIYNQLHGIPFYQAVLEWAKNPMRLPDEFARIQEKILGYGKAHLVLSCDEKQYAELKKERFFGLSEKLPLRPLSSWKGNFPLSNPESHARFIPSPVAFTALGLRTAAYQDPRSAFLLLASELFENCHLHKEIREKGGAYGSGSSYSPSLGNFYFYSYRDPHLAKTIAAFEKSIEKICDMKFSDQDLEEAKFGVIQQLDAPVAPGNRAITAFGWKRTHRTYENRQNFRKNILHANKADVAKAVEELILPKQRILVTFLGEELYKKEEKKLKNPLSILEI